MKTLKNAIKVGDVSYSEYELSPMSFVNFEKMARAAISESDENSSYQVVMRRKRIATQITLINQDGKRKLATHEIQMLPIKQAKELLEITASEEGVVGKKINDGDGVSTSIIYQLGTPIGEIKELEFFASTYGDLENVLCEDDKIGQTCELIKRVAKPVGMVAMPSSVSEQISMADGMTILTLVLPSFL